MAGGKRLKGTASKVGTGVRPLGNTTPTNALDDKDDNAKLSMRGTGKRAGTKDRKHDNPAKGARANKGKKVSGGASITGGSL